MIPTLEEIILGLIAGTVTKDDAWKWIHAHFPNGGYTLIDACVVAAWMNAELSEGQAMRALGLGRISARILRDKIVAIGVEMFALVNLGAAPESARNAIRDFDSMEPQRVCAHCQTQIIPSGLTECPKCDRPVMP